MKSDDVRPDEESGLEALTGRTSSRRTFLGKVGRVALGIGLAHFVLLGGSPVRASDDCPSGAGWDDTCSGADADSCPGGGASVDTCADPGLIANDYCPGGKDDSRLDNCYDGWATSDECPGGLVLSDVTDAEDRCEITSTPADSPSAGKDECPGGAGTFTISGTWSLDVCGPSGGTSEDYCPGGGSAVDNCGMLGAGDECTVNNYSDDSCRTAGSDTCSAADPDSCPGGASTEDLCLGPHTGDIDECPAGGSTYDSCSSSSPDVCKGGDPALDVCPPTVSTDTDECPYGASTVDVCNSSDQDECPNGLYVFDVCNADSPDVPTS